ncbi:CD209 [Branchiostoma lanceolatum]|uniref:CD209 protein n=1 Tax=Branchiostoma lanceolatum TaxID=7740 RepID=A0A8K0A4C2_BRALA|nr:CD209 [Branchiostoma lanceolatum]
MYEQAQTVRALNFGLDNGQTSGPASHYTPVHQSSARGSVLQDKDSPYKTQGWLETSVDTYEEPETVRLQIRKFSPPVQESGAQQTTPEAKSLQEEADATYSTPRHVDPSVDSTHRDGPGDRRGLFSFLRARRRIFMTAAFVVTVALVTTGLVLVVVFVNKTSQLSTTVDALKRSLANKRNRTAVLGNWRLLDKMSDTSVSCPEEKDKWPGTSASCPEEYTKWRGVCYKAFNTRRTFWQSDIACHDDGGTLAMPRDADTNAFLISLYKSVNNHKAFWIGLHDQREEGTFEWVDGTALCYSDSWAQGQPNNLIGIEDCVLFSPANTTKFVPKKWYDAPCHRRMLFLCQVVPGDT